MVFGTSTLIRAVAPFLLASSSSPPPSISSLQDIATRASLIYEALNHAPVYRQVSQTVKFSFVSPPLNGTSTWGDASLDSDLVISGESDRGDTVFHRVADKHGEDKPLAVYLPGLDGYGISAVQQYDDLAETFELWRMTVSIHDRAPFSELVSAVASFVKELSQTQDRHVTLIGESFGGALAPAVALRLSGEAERNGNDNPLKGLVMVNPATSFDDTQWSALGPFLASLRFLPRVDWLPTPYSVVGGMTLSTLIPDSKQLENLLSIILGVPVRSLDQISDAAAGLIKGFEILEKRLPAEAVQHRIEQWLPVASDVVNLRLASLDIPTLVVAGEDDAFLPSKKEAERLEREIPSCKKLLVKGSGHFVLDDRVNLTEAILYSDIDPLYWSARQGVKYDPITDWTLPSQREIEHAIETCVDPIRRFASPAFFSTDENGKRWKGLSKVPSKGPLVFVANHQLLGLDLGMIVAELLTERGIVARGLAHPVLFQSSEAHDQPRSFGKSTPGIQGTEEGGTSPFDSQLYRQFGAVMVTPRNYYRLLQTGQNALLFPGGVREVFHGKDEAYQLFWPNRTDFVRTAARFDATVIPISAVGAADSLNVLVDAPDLAKLPFGLGERVIQSSANVTSARFNVEDEQELFTPPFVVPSKPARHYFVFGKPMSTAKLDHKDIQGCEKFYGDVQNELNKGFDDVLRARENDPYLDPLRRLAYEGITGKQAPTFSMSEFDRH